jgi:hypothetical protein
VSSIPIPGGREQAKRVETGHWTGKSRDCGLHVMTDWQTQSARTLTVS